MLYFNDRWLKRTNTKQFKTIILGVCRNLRNNLMLPNEMREKKTKANNNVPLEKISRANQPILCNDRQNKAATNRTFLFGG